MNLGRKGLNLGNEDVNLRRKGVNLGIKDTNIRKDSNVGRKDYDL